MGTEPPPIDVYYGYNSFHDYLPELGLSATPDAQSSALFDSLIVAYPTDMWDQAGAAVTVNPMNGDDVPVLGPTPNAVSEVEADSGRAPFVSTGPNALATTTCYADFYNDPQLAIECDTVVYNQYVLPNSPDNDNDGNPDPEYYEYAWDDTGGAGTYAIPQVLTHELGHLLGIGDQFDAYKGSNGQVHDDSIMWWEVYPNELESTLPDVDARGLRFLFGT